MSVVSWGTLIKWPSLSVPTLLTILATMSETWLDSSVKDSLLAIPGFNIHRKDRHHDGGGVAIYTNVSLNTYHEPCLTLFSHLASWHQVFGLYFHALLIHSPITNLRSLNTEAHERMCSSIKCVARNCTNRKPAYAMLLRVHKHSKIAVLFEMLNNCPLQWYIFNPGLYMHAFQ